MTGSQTAYLIRKTNTEHKTQQITLFKIPKLNNTVKAKYR